MSFTLAMSLLGSFISGLGFLFLMFKWLIGRVDNLGIAFRKDLESHTIADTEALKEIHVELQNIHLQLAPIKVARKRAK